MALEAKRIMNGTWGTVWFEDDEMVEIKSFQAKDEYNKEEVSRVGSMSKGYKITAVDGKGSLSVNKVNSRIAKKIGKTAREGKTPTFTIIGKLDDPDAYGAERILLKGVIFDDLTLMDWEAGTLGSSEHPFTYEDYEYLDMV